MYDLPKAEVAEKFPPCEACGESAPHWYAKCRLCTDCLDGAQKIRAAVPDLSPRPTSPADPRVQEWQRTADGAVAAWVGQRHKSVRAA